MIEILLAMLMTLTPHKSDTETTEERRVRMTTVATAMVAAVDWATCGGEFNVPGCKRRWHGSRKDLAMSLMVQGENESHHARNVHAGNCKRYECDATFKTVNVKVKGVLRSQYVRGADGKRVVWFRARGIWQIQASAGTWPMWRKANGLDLESTTNAARLAALHLLRLQCGGNRVQMFTAQDGKGCGRVLARGIKRAGQLKDFVVKYERIRWDLRTKKTEG